jgi:outer membrane protein OmpA-like peptidoglycan-associated protein
MKKIAIALAAVVLSSTGCATKDYLHEYVASQIGPVSRTANEALDRAVAAGLLAEGKLLYEVVLTDDTLRFEFDSAVLSDQAKQSLDVFASRLKIKNHNVFIEIQGHTDGKGSDAHNLKLSDQRADAVRRYLNMKSGIPLHRLGTIGYGASAPVAANTSHDGRVKNRRVVLVVLA